MGLGKAHCRAHGQSRPVRSQGSLGGGRGFDDVCLCRLQELANGRLAMMAIIGSPANHDRRAHFWHITRYCAQLALLLAKLRERCIEQALESRVVCPQISWTRMPGS